MSVAKLSRSRQGKVGWVRLSQMYERRLHAFGRGGQSQRTDDNECSEARLTVVDELRDDAARGAGLGQQDVDN